MQEIGDPKIWISTNGPYLVSGAVPLTSRQPVLSETGEPIDWVSAGDFDAGEKYALCRCGGSRNKPFCDGTHKTIRFDGTLTAASASGLDRRRSYGSGEVVLTDDRSLCAHYGFCVNRVTNAWDLVAEASDPTAREQLEGMVERCPSGRLALLVGGRDVESAVELSVSTVPDGPLWVRGGIPMRSAEDAEYEVRSRVVLCRCGASANKPFCDGSHRRIGFRAR
jgi:CDGSH-type Zn-finger protein